MKVYISLTSIFDNQKSLLQTLQTILHQTHKPDKCYLYLSTEPYLLDKGFEHKTKSMSNDLCQLISENPLIEVVWCSNTGPYRKLLPLLSDKWQEDCAIITIDDDTEYAPNFIGLMLDHYKQHQCCISYRGFTMTHKASLKDLDYETRSPLTPKYLYNFHTGKGGVLYIPAFFSKVKSIIFNETLYNMCCPTGDDIWFNFMRIACGIPCYVNNDTHTMGADLTTAFSLYRNYNMKNNLNTNNIRLLVDKLMELGYLKENKIKYDSNRYWEMRYQHKGTSGDGSYGQKAEFKGKIINQVIDKFHIKSITDYGVGDGNQLKYLNIYNIKYVGLDVSKTAIDNCLKLHPNKRLVQINDQTDMTQFKSELVLSCDVIFHLVDDCIYYQYMKNLFDMSTKYVLIHSVDNDFVEADHVRFREFSSFIIRNYPQWRKIDTINNPLWSGRAGTMAFHLYMKNDI